MIKRVLITVGVVMVITLIALWLWLGGAARIAQFVRSMSNPIDILLGTAKGTYEIHLPGELSAPQGADISQFTDGYDSSSPESDLDTLEDRYESIKKQADELKNYGEPSPYRGRVKLSKGDAEASAPGDEYVVLDASAWNSSPVSLANWSLQSMLTGVRVLIPQAATPLVHGAVNTVHTVSLAPGETAFITTGPSPAGVSFRENKCTGYLEQLQDYEPTLTNACPNPSDAMRLTAGNIHQYGEDCVDFVASLPQCQFPERVPTSLSPSCRIMLANTFSYNGCVATYRNERDFDLDTWRLYLALGTEQWRNRHDIIRLLDAEGKTVDAVSY